LKDELYLLHAGSLAPGQHTAINRQNQDLGAALTRGHRGQRPPIAVLGPVKVSVLRKVQAKPHQ
jgi:hypothetical protein